MASFTNHLDVVKTLLSHAKTQNIKIDINQQDSKFHVTPVWAACCNAKSIDVVQLLIANGADPSIPRLGGCTSLWVAAQNGNIDVVRLLVKDQPCDVNKGDSVSVCNSNFFFLRVHKESNTSDRLCVTGWLADGLID